jgi:serine/threonine protein kinase
MSSRSGRTSRMGSRADMSNSSSDDLSSSLGHLTREQRERLTDVLDQYLSSLEKDAPLSQKVLLEKNADIAPALANYFRSLEDLHDMAAGFGDGPSHKEEPEDDEPPSGKKQIGDFELIREIGRGGMGVVYEARQISLDRQVAVKLLPFAAVLDAKQIARFKHEAQAAAQLHHPNIVPVFAIGVDRGVHFYAMQYIDGQPLDRAIDELRGEEGLGFRVQGSGSRGRRSEVRGQSGAVTKSWNGNGGTSAKQSQAGVVAGEEGLSVWSRPLERPDGGPALASSLVPPYAGDTKDKRREKTKASRLVVGSVLSREHYKSVARLGMQAAEALHAAHEYGVVHRDVKPSNLLVEASGKLWITDFGLARFGRDTKLTRSGDLVGTIRYMSPEQAAGTPALVDHRTDIYSLGITLYELACLKPAFPEEQEAAILKLIGNYSPPRPRSVRPDIPVDLETVIQKAMSPERESRYATAADLAADLKCILDERPTKARPPTLLDRAGRWAKRHQRAVSGGLLALILTLVGLTTAAAMITRASWNAKENAERADRSLRAEKEMLDGLAMNIAGDLEEVAGAESVRQNLLRKTARHYRRLMDDTEGTVERRSGAAVTYSAIGSMLVEMGLVGESVEMQKEASKFLEELIKEAPDDVALQKQLAVVESRWGVALTKMGQAEEAKEQLQKAIRRQERLIAREPADESVQADLALSISNLALVQHELRDSGQALETFDDAAKRFERLLAKNPGDEQLQQQLAMVFNNWAAEYASKRPTEAGRLHGRAVDLLRKAAGEDTSNLNVKRDLGLSLNNLGAALTRSGETQRARRAYSEAIGIRRELVQAVPARPSFQQDLATSWNNLGNLENRQGDFEAAAAAFGQAIELYEPLAEKLSRNAAIQSSLGSVYSNLAINQEQAGELEGAADSLAKAVEFQQRAVAISPDVPLYQGLLAKHVETRMRVLALLGRDAKSEEKSTNRFQSASEADYIGGSAGIESSSSHPSIPSAKRLEP